MREELKQIREHSDFAKGYVYPPCVRITHELMCLGGCCRSLSSMNLPASIEGSGDKDPLPHSLREKSRTVRQEGGPEGIEELVTTLNKLADVCTSPCTRPTVKLPRSISLKRFTSILTLGCTGSAYFARQGIPGAG